jgi:hypothetical protein
LLVDQALADHLPSATFSRSTTFWNVIEGAG